MLPPQAASPLPGLSLGQGRAVKDREGLTQLVPSQSNDICPSRPCLKLAFSPPRGPCMGFSVMPCCLADGCFLDGDLALTAHSPCLLGCVPHGFRLGLWSLMCLLGAVSKTRNMLGKVSNGLGQGPLGSCSVRFWEPDIFAFKGLWLSVQRPLTAKYNSLTWPELCLDLISFLLHGPIV